jgi:hypothetical protein
MASANATTTNSSLEPPPPTNPNNKQTQITPLQLAFAAMILGSSAGLALYTKRTSQMLNQWNQAARNAQERKGPVKFGPRTRDEWEKMRNRWEVGDL